MEPGLLKKRVGFSVFNKIPAEAVRRDKLVEEYTGKYALVKIDMEDARHWLVVGLGDYLSKMAVQR